MFSHRGSCHGELAGARARYELQAPTHDGGRQPIRAEYSQLGTNHRPGYGWGKTPAGKGIDPAVDQYLDIWDRLASAVPSYGRSC